MFFCFNVLMNQMKPIAKILIITLLGLFLVGGFAFAQYGLEKLKEGEELPIVETQRNIPQVVGGIIRWVLGIIGVLLVALIIYGGVMYATSAGNEEQVKKARGVLTYSIVGVTVIALAFIITNYAVTILFPEPPTSPLPGDTSESRRMSNEGESIKREGDTMIAEGEGMIREGQRLVAEGRVDEGQDLINRGEQRVSEGKQRRRDGLARQAEAAERAREEAEERGRAEEQARAAGCNTACQRCSIFNRDCCPGYECRSDVEGGLTEWLPYGAACVKRGTEPGGTCCRKQNDKCGALQLGDCCPGLRCPDLGEPNEGKCTPIPKGEKPTEE
jgi:hypothetical protein